MLTLFSISWDGRQWHAQPLFGPGAPSVAADSGNPILPPACIPVQDALQGSFLYFTQVRYIAAASPAQGCLAIAALNPNTAPPALAALLAHGTTTAQFLGRFGLLIHLDAAARTIAPGIGAATADEMSLAQQLAAYPGVICTLHGASGC